MREFVAAFGVEEDDMVVTEDLGEIAEDEFLGDVRRHWRGFVGGHCEKGDPEAHDHVVENDGEVAGGDADVHVVAEAAFGDEVVKLDAGTGVRTAEDERMLEQIAQRGLFQDGKWMTGEADGMKGESGERHGLKPHGQFHALRMTDEAHAELVAVRCRYLTASFTSFRAGVPIALFPHVGAGLGYAFYFSRRWRQRAYRPAQAE